MIIKSLLAGDINTICIIMLFFGVLIIAFIKGIKKLISQDKKKTIIFLLLTILMFALLSVFTLEGAISKRFMPNYISMQVFALLFGIVHVYLLEKFFKWEKENKAVAQLLFTCIALIAGSIAFIQIAGRFGIKDFHYFFLTGTLPYLFPWIFKYLFNSAMNIPLAIYKKWEYPTQQNYLQPRASELKNPLVIRLEVPKNNQDPTPSRFKVKAPERMDFGKFFYHFVNDYNEKHPESTINPLDHKQKPSGWIFYKKPRFIGRWKQINTDQTISRNAIKENQCIVCERVAE